MNKPFRFNFSKNTDKNLRFQIPIIFRLGDKKWNISIRTTLFNLLMSIIHWNFNQTKGQGTGKMCSLWQGFVKSSFFFIFLVCNHVTRQPCCGSIQYIYWRIYMKIESSSQRRGNLLFLTTNMAAMTSCAKQQIFHYHWDKENHSLYQGLRHSEVCYIEVPLSQIFGNYQCYLLVTKFGGYWVCSNIVFVSFYNDSLLCRGF